MSNTAVRVVSDADLTADWMILQDIATERTTVVIRKSASGDPEVVAEAVETLRAVLRIQSEAA